MSGYARRAITLEPGEVLGYDEGTWRDAIVFVDGGAIVLECVSGHARRFAGGATLWLAGLPLRCLRNDGPSPVRLVAISRRAPVTGACRPRRSLATGSPEEMPPRPA